MATNSVLEPWILWLTLKRFHSHGWHLCKFIGTKENVCIRKEFNSHMSGLGHQHGHRFIVLIGTPIWPPWRRVKTLYKAFSLTWPVALQIYWNKSKFIRKKKVQPIRDFIRSPTWPPFHCFEMTISWTWRHVKILYSDVFVFLYKIAESWILILFFFFWSLSRKWLLIILLIQLTTEFTRFSSLITI